MHHAPLQASHTCNVARTIYTADQKQRALDLAQQLGSCEAARQTGIPEGTIAAWRNRAGAPPTDVLASRAASNQALQLSVAERKARLVANLLGDVERLRGQLFAPTVEKKALTVSDGHLNGAHVEIVDVAYDEPTFPDKRALMTTIAIAVDKILLLSGEATQRTETIDRMERSAIEEKLAKVLHLKAS
jgi:hypothetical protein